MGKNKPTLCDRILWIIFIIAVSPILLLSWVQQSIQSSTRSSITDEQCEKADERYKQNIEDYNRASMWK